MKIINCSLCFSSPHFESTSLLSNVLKGCGGRFDKYLEVKVKPFPICGLGLKAKYIESKTCRGYGRETNSRP